MAIEAKYEGQWIAREYDDRVFDIANWDYRVGNHLVMLREWLDGSESRPENGGRSFVINNDGTVAT